MSSGKDWSDKKIFTTGEAAQVCNVSQQTIIRCFDNGRLNGFRVPGSKFRRIPREELIRFMKLNEIPLESIGGGARRVLVVDDDKRILELFRDVFATDDRFDVKTATTGYDAGLLTERHTPHLVVLDYMLPDVNGNIVCRRLRENPRTSHAKVLFISGVVRQEEIDDLLAAGGDGFLKKPFDVQELMRQVESILELTPAGL